jgi:hypothetical protein
MCLLFNEYDGIFLPDIPFNVTISGTISSQ